MKLLPLAVLLTVMQASPPVRKATDNSAQATAQIKSNGTDGNQQSVSISKLPTVTVAAPKRDLADWGYWAFSGLLVIVGFLQVLLLWRTLRAIQRQADDMGRQVDLAFGQLRAMHEQITEMSAQTDVLEKSVTVAQESANTARENFEAYIRKERAFVLIDKPSKPLQEMFDQSSDEYFGLGYRHFRLLVTTLRAD